MRRAIATMVMFAIVSPVQAEVINCIGMDSTHKTVKVLANSKKDEMIVNGEIFKITEHKSLSKIEGIFTNNFISEKGNYIYNILGLYTGGKYKGEWFFGQKNAATNESITFFIMSCSIQND